MPFTIVRQDITKMELDAIVNAANTELKMGGGVCGAIFKAAGEEALEAACRELAPIKTGQAVITPGFKLPARYVIHAAGPVYSRIQPGKSARLLRSAYTRSLELALENGCGSIAFPLISSGTYGFPKDKALNVATDAIKDFLSEHEMDVYLAVFDKAAVAVSEKLMGAVERYIDDKFVDERESCRRLLNVERQALSEAGSFDLSCPAPSPALPCAAAPMTEDKSLDDLIGKLDEPFNTTLLRLIDLKGKTDAEVYKRANIDRKLFSKIRTGKGYMPSKRTILALAIALELSLAETDDLLERAGYALSHSQMFDVIVEFFIVSGRYDIFEINQVLFKYDQALLG